MERRTERVLGRREGGGYGRCSWRGPGGRAATRRVVVVVATRQATQRPGAFEGQHVSRRSGRRGNGGAQAAGASSAGQSNALRAECARVVMGWWDGGWWWCARGGSRGSASSLARLGCLPKQIILWLERLMSSRDPRAKTAAPAARSGALGILRSKEPWETARLRESSGCSAAVAPAPAVQAARNQINTARRDSAQLFRAGFASRYVPRRRGQAWAGWS